MKRVIIIFVIIVFSIILGLYFLIPPEIKNLLNSSINQSKPKYKIEQVNIENEIRKISDFTKVEISYSISGKIDETDKDYNFENFVVVYLDKKLDFKEKEIEKIGPKINDIISENIINIDTYKTLKVIFMDISSDKFNDSKSRTFSIKTTT